MPLDPIAYQPYADPDDFIREVTDLIWVNRSISYIRENYEPDSIVHGSLGTSTTRDEVIEGSLMRISATPDRTGQAEDVVWEARGDDAFLSSHLVFSGHLHSPEVSRTIANCLYRRGRMVEEWVVRDSLAGALYHGLDVDELARAQSFRGYSGSWLEPAPVDPIAAGDSGPRPDDYRPEVERVLELIDVVWNQRDLHQVEQFFDRDLTLLTVGNRTVIRPEGYRRALLRFLEAFPAGQFEVRDIQTNYDVRYAGLRVAVTWKFTGDYVGRSNYGPLTGKPVDVLGISQFTFHNGKLVREVRLWDDIALRAQIAGMRGDEPLELANIY
ncbi:MULTISPECIES: ester cyclase [Microbacterium]|uniref:nuclear transport factor 2 family protein n=1 Tax=Microbacterium TaxID=33882 RepID=UPI00278AC85E|nr:MULTISPECIES: ester cyclase [Microbacterium]MDQ1082485.1 putative ester cyclase [Microbacterium sp. SORGH_AS_0344]MDQ1168744.1 putative ester cyclase [Microbacterium proteolyticum]